MKQVNRHVLSEKEYIHCIEFHNVCMYVRPLPRGGPFDICGG